ncbi:aminotransferase class III-fold pyridoxal phosphate-dependent enzyme [Acerihabitans arboris]|uniref:Aminotransferase class III-fold pyridoxal phosphate-dependent enzyme n=1 Tax=Acerihabitans arboris TaxID=2691583 RepID=A0A845SJT2_9GAMM|nr:aminotransferase class III-fold pyridoxal phosphate-dependent enzyme [Acerihabitans arboris]NDL63256.1 aminotransferase class III-fold pyridoxal phosphate-dependent enzyme [Acerihabitans arboris]
MKHLVGGISSAGRALPEIDGYTPVIEKAAGAWLWDQRGQRYLDTALGFGATLLGHNPPSVVDAVRQTQQDMLMPAFPHALEEEAAARLSDLTGELDKVIFVNSGSEAVHLAARAARAATGRRLVVKFAAGYDGWFDNVAFGNAGSAPAEMPGTARPEKEGMLLLRYNDFQDVDALFAAYRDIAAIIVEPVMANAGCIEPAAGYLQYLAERAHQAGALVILDEVLMGFRLHAGLAGHLLGVDADFATVGKAIGSGTVVAALVGKARHMAVFDDGRAVRAGTYSGNPPVCAAVIATLAELRRQDYRQLLARGDALRQRVTAECRARGVALSSSGYGTVFTLWPRASAPEDYPQALAAADKQWSLDLHIALRRRLILTMPFVFGRFYLSFSHDQQSVDLLAAACGASIMAL